LFWPPAESSGPPRLLPPMAIRRSTWRVDRLMSDELAAASIPDAAIAITRGEQVLRVRGYGHDVDDVPITEDTLSASLR
jgi:hypothetical protein